MALYPGAAPQGPTKAALPVIDGGMPTNGDPGGDAPIFPSRAATIGPNSKKAI